MTMNTRRGLAQQRFNGSPPEYNIAIVGALGVGKSALTVKYITKRFIMEYDPDLEGTYTKHEDWDNLDLVVHLMDTCDKEDSDPARYLKWADAFVTVYSITNRQSFETAREYVENITQFLKQNSRDCPVALVGNKIDLERYRQVSKAEGSALSVELECLFYETTAAEEYDYVATVFSRLITEVHAEKYGVPLQPLFIAEERATPRDPLHVRQRPKSPKGPATEKKDEKNPQKKNFSKLFKIFN
ncbi:ras-like protein family member 12 [Littorina saxatilis]|uniref:small monomeric GTPase n=1 Tax=Littorina saxatilis TaxID=31220 RepID=A0AAN9C292_9CAEN